MTMQTQTLTVMIVDLVGSTQIVERISRDVLVTLMEDITQPIRLAVAEFGGTIVKFTGDGYMAHFPSASDGLRAAARVVEAFTEMPILPQGQQLEGVRVVLHTADVILQDGDLLGEGVVTAARMEKHVPTNQVYLTSTVRECAKTSEFEFEPKGELLLKGLTNPVRVYRLVTDPLSGVERDTFLMVADLLGMSRYVTEAPVEIVNRLMMRWVSLMRDACTEYGGRLRSIVGDNLLTTFDTATEAYQALQHLEELVAAHNHNTGALPAINYSALICRGDLFVLSLGVNGPLVSRAFRLINQIPAGMKAAEIAVFDHAAGIPFSQFATQDGTTLYVIG
jgi:class 3 adenylate cyclase